MAIINKIKKDGFSLQKTFTLILAISFSITAILLFTTHRTFRAYYSLSEATDKYIELQETANRLLQASDYLTEEAQCYTVNGDRRHLENYFEEVEVHKNREKAIEDMEKQIPDSQAVDKLKDAMAESISLMDREYHAMMLVLSANEDKNIPELMKDTKLTPEEVRFSKEQKIQFAQNMVHSDQYYAQKDIIYANMEECINALKGDNITIQKVYEKRLHAELLWMTFLIFIQSVFLVWILAFATRTGIKPLVDSVKYIKEDKEIPLIGANEFKYLATAYNRMFSSNKKNIEQLSYKALHDELTGLYNRAGYDVITSQLNPETTTYLLIDTDNFKEINDNYGHDIGDKILKKIADTLTRNFRPDDYVFRLGGDEFAVLIANTGESFKKTVGTKISDINRSLTKTNDELPGISISVGIDMNHKTSCFGQLYQNADKALYKAKENGRNEYIFY